MLVDASTAWCGRSEAWEPDKGRCQALFFTRITGFSQGMCRREQACGPPHENCSAELDQTLPRLDWCRLPSSARGRVRAAPSEKGLRGIVEDH